MSRRVAWERVLAPYVPDLKLSSTGQLVGTCPFCRHKRVSFAVHAERGLWICYHCNRRGHGRRLLTDLRAEPVLAEAGLISSGQEDTTVRLPDEFEPLKQRTQGNARFWDYARRRGLSPEVIRDYGIGFCRRGYYAGRLIVPVICEGRLASFVARDITGKQDAKILTPKGNRQSLALMNYDRVLGRDDVVVVEGVFDCLVLPEIAVASFGRRLSAYQIGLLVRAGFRRVYLCWDADAYSQAADAAAQLALWVDTRVVRLPRGDPNSLGGGVVRALLATAEKTSPVSRTSLRIYDGREAHL